MNATTTHIPLGKILPNPQQPRHEFDPEQLRELAESIRENGLIQPVIVEAFGDEYILIAGERRLRASKMIGAATIEAVVRPAMNGTGERERLIQATVENLQRADLSPIEEAKAYDELRKMGFSNEKIARRMGTTSARVVSRLVLLDLPEEVQGLVSEGKFSRTPDVVKAVLDIPDREAQVEIARRLSYRRASNKTSIAACKRLKISLEAREVDESCLSLRMAQKSAGLVDKPKWNALEQLGRVPPWKMVERSARSTCAMCALSIDASEMVCKDCPVVHLLRDMIKECEDAK